MTTSELEVVPQRTVPVPATVDATGARAVSTATAHLAAISDLDEDLTVHDALYDLARLRDAAAAIDRACLELARAVMATGEVTQARVVEASGVPRGRLTAER